MLAIVKSFYQDSLGLLKTNKTELGGAGLIAMTTCVKSGKLALFSALEHRTQAISTNKKYFRTFLPNRKRTLNIK